MKYYMYVLLSSVLREDTANNTYHKIDITEYANELLFYDSTERIKWSI